MATAKNGRIGVEAFRVRVADAVGLAVSELITSRTNDPRAALLRMVAGYFLQTQDKLSVGEIAKILEAPEQWVRDSINYVERRVAHYYAFRVYIEKAMDAYALTTGKPTAQAAASGVDIERYRQRAAAAAGVTTDELIAPSSDDSDAETVQKVAAYLLLSRDELGVADVARILCRSEQWASFLEGLRRATGKAQQRSQDVR